MNKLEKLKALLLEELTASRLELLAVKGLDTENREAFKQNLQDIYESLLAREDKMEDILRTIESLLEELES